MAHTFRKISEGKYQLGTTVVDLLKAMENAAGIRADEPVIVGGTQDVRKNILETLQKRAQKNPKVTVKPEDL